MAAENIDGIYKHYEGTDMQCSGVQLQRELTWATDVGTAGQLRYVDCSGIVHYISGEGSSGYFFPTDDLSRGSGVYYSGPSGINDFIKFGNYSYIQADSNGSLVISSDSGNPTIIKHNTNDVIVSGASDVFLIGNSTVNISGNGVSILAGDDINISGNNVIIKSDASFTTTAVNATMKSLSRNGTLVAISGFDVNMFCDCGTIYIKNTVGGIYASGNGGAYIRGFYGAELSSADSDVNVLADCGDVNIVTDYYNSKVNIDSAGTVGISGYGGVEIRADSGYVTVSGSNGVRCDSDIYSIDFTNYTTSANISGWASYTVSGVYYKKLGSTVDVWFHIDGTSNSTSSFISVPYSNKVGVQLYEPIIAVDSGNYTATTSYAYMNVNSSVIEFNKTSGGDWAASAQKSVRGHIRYETN
jgi:hypothetical protein